MGSQLRASWRRRGSGLYKGARSGRGALAGGAAPSSLPPVRITCCSPAARTMTLEEVRCPDTVPESTARWVCAGTLAPLWPRLVGRGRRGGSRPAGERARVCSGAGACRCVPARGAGGCVLAAGEHVTLRPAPRSRRWLVRRMQGAGKALHELLLSAQRQGCLTAGVYESAKVLNV